MDNKFKIPLRLVMQNFSSDGGEAINKGSELAPNWGKPSSLVKRRFKEENNFHSKGEKSPDKQWPFTEMLEYPSRRFVESFKVIHENEVIYMGNQCNFHFSNPKRESSNTKGFSSP